MRVSKLSKNEGPTKEKIKHRLLSFLSDPDNEWPQRTEYSTQILNYKNPTHIYQYLTPIEIGEIENKAFENIKAQTARKRKKLYNKLYKQGKDDGNVTATKEYLDRTEGKVKDKLDITASVDNNIKINFVSVDNEPSTIDHEQPTENHDQPTIDAGKPTVDDGPATKGDDE